MSEYQYYEFQAIDRPLTPDEMSEVRKLSTRARITPTQFQNSYSYGSFKGDPGALVERYYDVFVYVANWGTHQFMLRLPASAIDLKSAQAYAIDGGLDVVQRGGVVILEFLSEDEEGYGWIDDDESAAWMPSLLGVRAEIATGDIRALYLGWLAGARSGYLDDDEAEPPVPPGLARLSASQTALASFLRLDADLLAVAAAGSSAPPPRPTKSQLEQWVAGLPAAEKDAILVRLVNGEVHLGTEIERRFRAAVAPRSEAQSGSRTVAELLTVADEKTETRQREEAERAETERKAREAAEAAARARYLEGLIGREQELWRQADMLGDTKRPRDYDDAVPIITDLHDLSVRQKTIDEFTVRLGQYRVRNAKRPSLIDRLDRAGLPA